MTLTLRIRNMDRLDNGVPTEFLLNNRGAIIGRAATCDWSLPDPRNYISSRHAEVTFRDGFYLFNDISTNGTFLNGSGDRMAEPRRIESGDLFLIGHYEVEAGLSGAASVAVERQEQQAHDQARQEGGFSWDAGAGPPPPPAAPDRGGWGDAPPNAGLASGAGGMAAPSDGGWGAPPVAPPPASGGWDAAPTPPASGGWGAPPAPPPSDNWGAPPAPPPADGWAPAPAAPPSPSPSDGWGAPPAPPPPPPAGSDWGAAPAPPSNNDWGATPPSSPPPPPPAQSNWAAPPPPPAAEQPPSQWEEPKAPVQQASAWSSAVADGPKPASPDKVWGSMEESNSVDWSRAFGDKPGDAKDLLGLDRKPADALPPAPPPVPGAPPAGAPGESRAVALDTAPPSAAAPPPPAAPDMGELAVAFGKAAGLKAEQIKEPSAETIERAATVMRRLVSGLVVMVEARARAKSQMGAEQTGLEFDGNNPIKFARTPDQALAQLLNAPERGFMNAEKAVEDAYFDLQSHQMATLKAMQGALRATLDRFSPAAIKRRAEKGGVFARIMPGGRDSTLWQTYEREFSGVSEGSDEAFMDVFAKEFRFAYEELNRNRNR